MTRARRLGAPVNRRAHVEALADASALVRWRTTAPAAGRIRYGTAAGRLTAVRYATGRGLRHLTLLAGLAPGRRYYYRLVARDALGRRAVSRVASFRVPAYGVAESRLAQWRTGSRRGIQVGARDDGELSLAARRPAGTFVSRLLDAREMVAWWAAGWSASVPRGARLEVSVRSGSTSTGRLGWTRWIRLAARGGRLPRTLLPSRYLQYRVRMLRSGRRGPVLRSIWFTSDGSPPRREAAG